MILGAGKLVMMSSGAGLMSTTSSTFAVALAGVLVAFAIQEEVRGAPTLWCDESAMPIFDD
jgi:hypothetical protein